MEKPDCKPRNILLSDRIEQSTVGAIVRDIFEINFVKERCKVLFLLSPFLQNSEWHATVQRILEIIRKRIF